MSTTDTPTAYAQAVADWDRLRAERTAETKRHEAEVARLTTALREAEHVMAVSERAGLLVADAYVVARNLLQVQWSTAVGTTRVKSRTAEVTSCFRDAIEDLRRGAPRLRSDYFGVKQYDRWDSQRTDCSYGMGPSHGSIWFRIGLRRPKDDLTEDQRLACITWLRAVEADPDGLLS